MEQQENELERCCYQVMISGHLDESWGIWLDCATIVCEINEANQMPVTILTCPVTDQPALRGLLNKLFDLNLTILSVNRRNPDTDKNKLRET
jgi:hypothetical protein